MLESALLSMSSHEQAEEIVIFESMLIEEGSFLGGGALELSCAFGAPEVC